MSDGQRMLGSSVSWKTAVKLQEVLFLLASVAVNVTVLVPLLKVEPLGGRQTLVTPGQLSLTVDRKCVAKRKHGDVGGWGMMNKEQRMLGSSASWTMIAKLHEALFPLASVAVQVTGW